VHSSPSKTHMALSFPSRGYFKGPASWHRFDHRRQYSLYARLTRRVCSARLQIRNDRRPDSESVLSFFAELIRKKTVRAPAMRDGILLVIAHLGEGFLRVARLEPGVPAEVPLAARLDEDLSLHFSHEHLHLVAVPVADAALRARSAIVERVRDRREP